MIEYNVKVYPNGNKAWFLNGLRHRKDGPAIEHLDGYKSWWINGLRHREDGPAIEYINGVKVWALNGVQYTEEGFQKKQAPVKELTVKEISEFLGCEIKVVK